MSAYLSTNHNLYLLPVVHVLATMDFSTTSILLSRAPISLPPSLSTTLFLPSILTPVTLLLAVLVRVTPDHPVLTVASGETVILRCHRPNATIGWSVNETTLGSSTFKGLVFNSTSHSFLNGSQIQLLIFTADESYSGISITCIASFDVVGQNPEETPPIRIVVQGIQVY